MAWPLYPQGKSLRCPLNGRINSSTAGLDVFEKKKYVAPAGKRITIPRLSNLQSTGFAVPAKDRKLCAGKNKHLAPYFSFETVCVIGTVPSAHCRKIRTMNFGQNVLRLCSRISLPFNENTSFIHYI
jgi:hypothetical protein